ncbi:Transposase-like protein [Streptomyces venezuelae]|uniref:hypothetical protein n=1 Tax=Streptomyces gardneri TaxID=66892 RepID=UPI0006BD0E9E|nr:hypothetical protein [Streptomyces gardneri]ALO05659.1 Transposase-like protein [Streptomyces venezuelae]WRK34463.1 hypothetical protein U0M97_00270 [Streptomyces venezuelae]CUM44166.1 Mobile element protein [Streptomyces venezuelae]
MLDQARSAGRSTPVHDAWWAAAVKAHGERECTRVLIEVLLLGRHLPHEHLVTGLAAALRTGALTAYTVALEARKAAEEDSHALAEPVPPTVGRVGQMTAAVARTWAHVAPERSRCPRRPTASPATHGRVLW